MKKKLITATIAFVSLFFALGIKAYADENATMYCYYNASLKEYLFKQRFAIINSEESFK